ncbi:hypothetical protein E2C01_033504 [Portunus trituberculatus]|uniref:Uncharacterized protein n=1 Tax=Portunus trituberculatus TaxID=210409 RepID=A0A5B7EYU7_PORTR|nr:hypothetical protein [Portunus trituberculatus]
MRIQLFNKAELAPQFPRIAPQCGVTACPGNVSSLRSQAALYFSSYSSNKGLTLLRCVHGLSYHVEDIWTPTRRAEATTAVACFVVVGVKAAKFYES